MTTRYLCLRCGAEGPQSELPDHKCPTDPKPDPADVLEGHIPARPEAPAAPWLNRPADHGLNLDIHQHPTERTYHQ